MDYRALIRQKILSNDFWLLDVVMLTQFCLVQIKEDNMTKESKHRREDRKKPQMTLKERRAKKHEKKHQKEAHSIEQPLE